MQAKYPNGMNLCHDSGLLTAAGAEKVYDTTVIIPHSLNGKLYRKAAVADGTTPTTDVNTSAVFNTLGASKGCVFLWLLNSSGTVSVAQGDILDLDAAGNFDSDLAPSFPHYDEDTYTPFAYMVAKVGSTGSGVVFGATNWNDTGFTNVIVNLSSMPSRPQTS